MKNTVVWGALLGALLSSCTIEPGDPANPVNSFSAYEPVLMERAQLERSVEMKPARDINDAGKIYRFGTYLLINERFKGIHVIDNQDPASPQNIGFVQVPGCIDIAAKGGTVYADNAVDLIALDISDIRNIREVSRVRQAFPELPPPDNGRLSDEFTAENRPAGSIIVGYRKKTK